MNVIDAPPEVAARPELLDVRSVALMLDCCQRHIYRLADAGLMPAPVRLGRAVRWKRSSLLKWLDAGCPAVRQQAKGVQ